MQLPLTTLLRKEPPPEGKPWNKADNFCLIVRKHDEARGSHEVAEHFCEFFRKKNEQGQGLKKREEFKLTSLGALRHSPRRGKQG